MLLQGIELAAHRSRTSATPRERLRYRKLVQITASRACGVKQSSSANQSTVYQSCSLRNRYKYPLPNCGGVSSGYTLHFLSLYMTHVPSLLTFAM